MKLVMRCVVFFAVLSCINAYAYKMEYQIELVPEKHMARVKLIIDNTEEGEKAVKEISFKNKKNHSNYNANGRLDVGDERITWQPPKGIAWLSLEAMLLHERDPGEYDSFINNDWALFRGDDLFPPSKVVARKGASAEATLHFSLPKSWPYINTVWERDKTVVERNSMNFFINNPERNFDRPVGWMIAGKISTRRDYLGETYVSVSGPERDSFEENGAGFKRMEILTFLHFVWPEVAMLLPEQPRAVLIVGAGDPMWRGALSGPYSLFIHEDRPLVSENATSTLLHELFHSITRIRGQKNDDWIAEGLAEYYAVMLLYRAGGMADERLQLAFGDLSERSKKIKTLRQPHSTGATTAKAALVFRDLDMEIKEKSDGKHSLDDVVKTLVLKNVSLEQLKEAVQGITGFPSKILDNIK
jgi:hypothetical protein